MKLADRFIGTPGDNCTAPRFAAGNTGVASFVMPGEMA